MNAKIILLLNIALILNHQIGFAQNDNIGQKSITIFEKNSFNKIIDGKQIKIFTLRNNLGTVSQITNYGGKVVSLWLSDKFGNFEDVVLGHPNINDYLQSKEKYFGALIGRYGNRIANGKFVLDDDEYSVAKNNGDNHLHGGNKGYDSVVWDAEQVDGQTLILKYYSKDMEEGYPGNLTIKVKYQLTDNNELKIEYWATTDASTFINLTHHSFFNLRGAGNGTINNHLLQVNAAYYTPVDKGLIPTGEITTVEDTPFDFHKLIKIGERVDSNDSQL
jgi:aldose 1-epimerase